ncbi:tyrosine-type recombinase/integrase [Hydrogenimonas sp.]
MAIVASDYTNTKYPGLKIHKDSLHFLFDIRIHGKRFRKVWLASKTLTKSDRIKKALIELEEFRKVKEHDMSISAPVDATVKEYWEKVKSLKSWSSRVETDYQNFYNRYLQEIGKMKIRKVKPSVFTTLNQRLGHLSPRTRKKWHEILNPVFELAIEDEIILKSPIKKKHIPKRDAAGEKRVVLNAVEKYKKIHETIHSLFADNPHHRALFLFGFYGRRLSEVTETRWEDIDFENDEYKVRKEVSKVDADMIFTLPADLKEALSEFRQDEGRVFYIQRPRYWYGKIREASGVEEFHFHWMRNLVVSALSAMGVSSTDMSALLGHMDAHTLKKYLSLQRAESTARIYAITDKLLVQNPIPMLEEQ